MELDQSHLFRLVYDSVFNRGLAQPFSVLVGDYEFGPEAADVRLLCGIAQVAGVAHAPFVAAASPSMFRRETFHRTG